MKYRDLVLVLVFVAVGVLWWSGPQSVASEAQEKPPQVAASSEPTPTDQTLVQVQKQNKQGASKAQELGEMPRPNLQLSVEEAKRLDDLVITARLTSNEPVSVLIGKETGHPQVVLTASLGERYWQFRSKEEEQVEDFIPKSTTDLSWQVRISDLVAETDDQELRTIYEKEKLDWVMTLTEAQEKTNPMTRRVVWPIMGSFTTP